MRITGIYWFHRQQSPDATGIYWFHGQQSPDATGIYWFYGQQSPDASVDDTVKNLVVGCQ